jgi:hypothetical protein
VTYWIALWALTEPAGAPETLFLSSINCLNTSRVSVSMTPALRSAVATPIKLGAHDSFQAHGVSFPAYRTGSVQSC